MAPRLLASIKIVPNGHDGTCIYFNIPGYAPGMYDSNIYVLTTLSRKPQLPLIDYMLYVKLNVEYIGRFKGRGICRLPHPPTHHTTTLLQKILKT
jgi:hypothetical protein